MALPKRILVPVDFSRHSDLALDDAIDLGSRLKSEIHVLHVQQIPELLVPDAKLFLTPSVIGALDKASRAAVDELVEKKKRAGIAIVGHVGVGDPRVKIEEAAKAINADLICMGTHGRGPVREAVLGSVSGYIVRTSSIPVLTVRAMPDVVDVHGARH